MQQKYNTSHASYKNSMPKSSTFVKKQNDMDALFTYQNYRFGAHIGGSKLVEDKNCKNDWIKGFDSRLAEGQDLNPRSGLFSLESRSKITNYGFNGKKINCEEKKSNEVSMNYFSNSLMNCQSVKNPKFICLKLQDSHLRDKTTANCKDINSTNTRATYDDLPVPQNPYFFLQNQHNLKFKHQLKFADQLQAENDNTKSTYKHLEVDRPFSNDNSSNLNPNSWLFNFKRPSDSELVEDKWLSNESFISKNLHSGDEGYTLFKKQRKGTYANKCSSSSFVNQINNVNIINTALNRCAQQYKDKKNQIREDTCIAHGNTTNKPLTKRDLLSSLAARDNCKPKHYDHLSINLGARGIVERNDFYLDLKISYQKKDKAAETLRKSKKNLPLEQFDKFLKEFQKTLIRKTKNDIKSVKKGNVFDHLAEWRDTDFKDPSVVVEVFDKAAIRAMLSICRKSATEC